MLREEYLVSAARTHSQGARFLRDCALALAPCCTLSYTAAVFEIRRTMTCAEELMGRASAISGGLLSGTALSKYTAAIEARMRLAGAEADSSLTNKQILAERTAAVAPGTRGEIYESFLALSERAEAEAERFVGTVESLRAEIKEGRAVCAVPVPAIDFMRLLCADYASACIKLARGEEAMLVRRADSMESFRSSLALAASAQGDDCTSFRCDELAARACSGLIPALPAILFEILLRYENLG